jgi:transglutaminase-like putative cysteine protease
MNVGANSLPASRDLAESTRSTRQSFEPEEASAVQSIPASLLLILLSVITAIGFCRIFVGWEFLGPMLFVVISVHALCLVLRLRNVPGYIAVPAAFVLLFSLLAWKYYPTTLSGPFPTMHSWELFLSDLRLARAQFPSAVAPVAAVGGFVVLATASTAVAAILSDAFAFRAYGRVETTVPTAVLLVFSSALGADRNRVAITAAWLACALAVVAVLRITHAQAENAWIGPRSRVLASVIPAAALLAGCAAVGGAWIGPKLPGAGEKAIINAGGHREITQVLSPLVDIRSRLVKLSNTELFNVGASEPNYWRATALTMFDGSTWKLPDGDLAPVSGAFAGVPANAHEVVQQIHIEALGGSLLPAAYSPTRVDEGSAYWVEETGTLVVPREGLQRASNFTIVSAVVDVSGAELAASTSVGAPGIAPLALPGDFPSSVTQTALAVTANASTFYDKAFALQNWFRSEFVYDLTVQRGHSNDALENFLRIRRGYCEQFSGAFAAMARSLGIPARVAVGFTPGDLGSDGRYHVFGRNAHAWPEVWFDSVGWVAFEPTPGRGQPGAQAHTGVEPEQANANDPGRATPVVAATPTTIAGPDEPTATVARDPATAATTIPVGAESSRSSTGDGPPWLIIMLGIAALTGLLWALALPVVLRRLRTVHRPPSPAEDIRRSWQRSAQALGMLGFAPRPDETPIEHASRAEKGTGIDGRTLSELANRCTAAVYGGLGDEEKARRCAELSTEVVQAVKELLSTRERMISMFDPRRARLLLRT